AESDRRPPLLPAQACTGRPPQHAWRTILHAIFYPLRTGGAWRVLPRAWPAWQTGDHSWRQGRFDGTGERLQATLGAQVRGRLGRDPQPSAGRSASQSVKTTGVGGERGADDGGKPITGRTRHRLGDPDGLVL